MSFHEFWRRYADVRVYKSKGSKVEARRIFEGRKATKDGLLIEPWMHPYLMKAADALNLRLQAEDQQWYNPPAVSVFLNQHRWEEYGIEIPERLRVVS